MIPVLLIGIPLLAGLIGFSLKDITAKSWALITSVLTLGVSLIGLSLPKNSERLVFDTPWMGSLNSHFAIGLDGIGQILCLLTAIASPLFLLQPGKKNIKKHVIFWPHVVVTGRVNGSFSRNRCAFILFFLGTGIDTCLFSRITMGRRKRIAATFKFFIYTFLGSLMMLIGIIYIYFHTKDHSFALSSFYGAHLLISTQIQTWLFWFIFIAFAVKMPIFPFHTGSPIPMNNLRRRLLWC